MRDISISSHICVHRNNVFRLLVEFDSTDRTLEDDEVPNEDFYFPSFHPKLPGRFYFLFGKAIETKGKEEMLKEENYRKDFYLHIKSEVENAMAYLIKKREEDPCRGIVQRIVHRAFSAPIDDNFPSFEP